MDTLGSSQSMSNEDRSMLLLLSCIEGKSCCNFLERPKIIIYNLSRDRTANHDLPTYRYLKSIPIPCFARSMRVCLRLSKILWKAKGCTRLQRASAQHHSDRLKPRTVQRKAALLDLAGRNRTEYSNDASRERSISNTCMREVSRSCRIPFSIAPADRPGNIVPLHRSPDA